MDFSAHPALNAYTGFLLRKISAVSFDRFSAATGRYGLHPMHFGMLDVLDGDGPIAQHELAQRVGVDPSTIVARMDVLEEKEMVNRHRSTADRRAYEIELTAKGRKTLAELRKAAGAASERTFGVLTAEERTQLHELLERVAAGIDQS